MKQRLTAFGAGFGQTASTDQTIAPEFQAILDRCDARRAAREALEAQKIAITNSTAAKGGN